MAKKAFAVLSISTLGCLFLLYNLGEFVTDDVAEYFYRINLLTTFYLLLSYTAATFLLLFFSNTIFRLWLTRIVSWFLPVSLLILAAAAPARGSVVSFERTDYAIVLGCVLTAITLIFALVQRFYYQRR